MNTHNHEHDVYRANTSFPMHTIGSGPRKIKTIPQTLATGLITTLLPMMIHVTVHAEAALEEPLYTFFGGGRYVFDGSQTDDKDYNDASSVIAGLEKNWHPHWGTELRYLYAEPQVHHGHHVKLHQADVSAIFYIKQPAACDWQPYVSLSTGSARLDSDDNLIAGIGGGLRWHIGGKVALKFDYRLNHVLDEDQSDHVVSMGINAVFNAAKKNQLGSADQNSEHQNRNQIPPGTKSLAKDINLFLTDHAF